MARRAAFLAHRVFASDLMYVDPVFFGFNLITDGPKAAPSPNTRTPQTTEGSKSQTEAIRVRVKSPITREEETHPSGT